MLSFLTPDFFSALVLLVVVIGLIIAAIRIRNDFRRGPRWPEKTPLNQENVEEPKHD